MHEMIKAVHAGWSAVSILTSSHLWFTSSRSFQPVWNEFILGWPLFLLAKGSILTLGWPVSWEEEVWHGPTRSDPTYRFPLICASAQISVWPLHCWHSHSTWYSISFWCIRCHICPVFSCGLISAARFCCLFFKVIKIDGKDGLWIFWLGRICRFQLVKYLTEVLCLPH